MQNVISLCNQKSLKCVFYTYSTSQFRLAIFQVLNNHMGLVATMLAHRMQHKKLS